MWVAVARLDVMIPGARSLKDRRQAVKSLKERLAGRFPVACAEVDDRESWTRASLGVSACANEKAFVEELMEEVVRYAGNDHGVMLGPVQQACFRFPEECPGLDGQWDENEGEGGI